MSFARLMMIALALLWAGRLAAAPKDGETFGDWRVACATADKGQRCWVYQRLSPSGSKDQLLRVEIGYFGAKGEPGATIMLPLGIYLPAGAAMKVDEGQQVNVPVLYCTPDGCVSRVLLEKPFLDSLLSGSTLRFGMLNVEQKQLTIPVSLKGLADGIKSLK